MASYAKYTVTQLKQLLEEKGFDPNGRKSELIERLLGESNGDLDDHDNNNEDCIVNENVDDEVEVLMRR